METSKNILRFIILIDGFFYITHSWKKLKNKHNVNDWWSEKQIKMIPSLKHTKWNCQKCPTTLRRWSEWFKLWQKSSHFLPKTMLLLLIIKYNKIIPMGDNSSYMLSWLPTIFLGLDNNWRRWWPFPHASEG